MLVVVAYDIADHKRLRRVAKFMEDYGFRVQRSVFECDLSPAQISALEAGIKALIKRKADRVQIYQLCENCAGALENGPPSDYLKCGDIVVI